MNKRHKYHNHNKFHKDMQENISNEKDIQNADLQPEETAEESTLEEVTEVETEQIECEEKDLTEEYNELKESNLRLLAEFDNYRKRTIKEKTELIKTAAADVFTEMLPIVDDFERAKQSLELANDILAVTEGVDLIYKKFVKFLNQHGIKEIPTENEDFNTEFHEAITLLPAPSPEQKGKIIECISKGYTMNDKVIRFAKVVIGE
ncbi:MAG: nucleotide exchange factor GrpE [Paludibacter sp.]|nr:nucleotide exchange factor GrpE [Paludibacter sp.]